MDFGSSRVAAVEVAVAVQLHLVATSWETSKQNHPSTKLSTD